MHAGSCRGPHLCAGPHRRGCRWRHPLQRPLCAAGDCQNRRLGPAPQPHLTFRLCPLQLPWHACTMFKAQRCCIPTLFPNSFGFDKHDGPGNPHSGGCESQSAGARAARPAVVRPREHCQLRDPLPRRKPEEGPKRARTQHIPFCEKTHCQSRQARKECGAKGTGWCTERGTGSAGACWHCLTAAALCAARRQRGCT